MRSPGDLDLPVEEPGEVVLAGFGRRAAAFLVDNVLALFSFLSLLALAVSGEDGYWAGSRSVTSGLSRCRSMRVLFCRSRSE